jgi:vitamin B12 transporter
MPVQFIRRVEIIKGPASSSWGPALGGVINVVTKDPNEDAKIGGTLSSSLGDRGTGDYRGELSGTMGNFGYYISGGKLASSGLIPNTDVDENNIYAKLRWDLPEKGTLNFTLGYGDHYFGGGQSEIIDFVTRYHIHELFSTLAFQYPINNWIDLELTGRVRDQDFENPLELLNTAQGVYEIHSNETVYGASSKIIFRQRRNRVVIGIDYDH